MTSRRGPKLLSVCSRSVDARLSVILIGHFLNRKTEKGEARGLLTVCGKKSKAERCS